MSGQARWEQLFGDLEAVLDAGDRAAFDADVADRSRAEQAALALTDRVRGHVGAAVTCRLVDGDVVTGTVEEVGSQWLLLDAAGAALLPMAAVATVSGLSRAAAAQERGLMRRLPLTVVLRGLARDRATVRLRVAGGATVEGTIDRVGVDHLDVAEHPADEPRRRSAVRGVTTVRLEAMMLLRVL